MKVPEKRKTIAAVIMAAVAGGGYVGVETILEMGDQRWVTVKSSNAKLVWYMEDLVVEIQGRIDRGVGTPEDHTRLAIMQDRIKRLQVLEY